MNTKVTSPEQFFGFRLGSDRKIARWDKIVEYFQKLDSESDRIKVIDMGETTEGNPFLLTIISSPQNLANLEHLRQYNQKICDPRGLSEEQVKALVDQGKVVICQSMSLHASEIGGTQMAPELAYDLLTRDCEETHTILNNVIFLMVPSFNPDGQIMVTDWYNRYVGTEYEGASLPWLYHKYAGHDNNRDAFAQNLVESKYMAKIMFKEWFPHAYQDHHHMGSYGPRFFVAPYSDPIRPNADPLVWREISWYGAHMAYKLEEEGKTGVINAAQFGGWGHLGFHWITPFHNIAGMLTESASAKLASPMYIHQSQLEGAHQKHHPKYEAQTNFPHPWPGGWWRLRDIVEQQKISSWSLLEIAARHRKTVLWNAYLKARRQTERGEQSETKSYLISPQQHDPLTVLKLVNILLNQGIEVQVAKQSFEVQGVTYPAGTYKVPMAQPKMGVIQTLLGRTFYPDSYWTRNPDGSPIMYDMATDTVAEFMGVKAVPVGESPAGFFDVVESVKHVPCEMRQAAAAYVLDGRLNDSYLMLNRLLARGADVWRADEPVRVGCKQLPAGAFVVRCKPGVYELLNQMSTEIGVNACALDHEPSLKMHKVSNLRVGMYQRYWGGNMDEGWTRLLLDRFEFPYVTLMDADIKSGSLNERLDVIILPHDLKQLTVDITKVDKSDRIAQRLLRYHGGVVPPEYKSGIGEEGVRNLGKFVNNGGRLVALDGSCSVAIEACGLKVRNVLEGLDHRSFYCHGSTLNARVMSEEPLAYGMPQHSLIFFLDSQAFEILESFHAEDYKVIVEYPKRDLLQSGWLIGEDKIAGKPAMLCVKSGKGEVVLIGFRTQHRAQTHGTFKLLFNSLI